jgi:hypothetical protein
MSDSRKYRFIVLIVVIAIVSMLLALLAYDYVMLESKYQSLNTAFINVSSELSEVQNSYNILLAEHEDLSRNYASLEEDYSTLEESYRKLGGDYAYLKTQYDDLSLRYERLNSEYSLALEEKESIEAWYSSLRKDVNVRQGFGEDKEAFITPSDAEVKRIVLETTGGWSNPSDWNEFWSDLKRLYDWVVDNVAYSYDPPSPVLPDIEGELYWRDECYRFPNETIRQKYGDCEDQAILLASAILSYSNEKYSIWVVEWVSISSSVGHVAVAIPVEGGKLTILDPTGRFYTSNTVGKVGSKDARLAVGEWLDYWRGQGYPDARINVAFSKNLYREFASNEEFIQWVLGG